MTIRYTSLKTIGCQWTNVAHVISTYGSSIVELCRHDGTLIAMIHLAPGEILENLEPPPPPPPTESPNGSLR